ncbi:mitochondrial ATP synthase g subunit-domain-containing protein [Gongronella butleri]|nr:mitochondrial ATP synthase g subunit-domain-containing protein [Gongronella butleri]
MSANKALSAVQSYASKLIALQKPIVYKAKVAGEIAKQVYVKEGMSFPTGAQVTEAQNVIKKNLNVQAVKNWTWTDLAKGGAVAAQFYTFFLVGEIVGRRNLIGYNVQGAAPAHH